MRRNKHPTLKIVQIVRAPKGGIRKHIEDIFIGLCDSKYENYLVTNEDDCDLAYSNFKSKKILKEENIFHFNILDSPSPVDFWNIFKIYQQLKNSNIDIIHGHGAKGGLYARIVGLMLGAKVFYTAHGGSLHPMHGTLKNILYKVIEKFLYYFTDKLIFESKHSMNTYSSIVHKNSSKFILNTNSIDIPSDLNSLTPVDFNDSTIKIASFGLLRLIKGHSIIIKTLPLLLNAGHNVTYDVYGTGDEEDHLNELAKSLKVDSIFKIHKYSKDILGDMNNYHIIAQPSLFESFGYVPIEAMSRGIPVITSNNGGLSEVMKNGEIPHVCKSNTPEEYYDLIHNIITNNDKTYLDKYKSLITSEYDVLNFRKKYIKVINDL